MERLMSVSNQMQQPRYIERLQRICFCRSEDLTERRDLASQIGGWNWWKRGIITRKRLVLKVPVFMQRVITISDVLTCRRVVWRTVPVMGAVRMVVRIAFDAIR